jgi:hypothetical protein
MHSQHLCAGKRVQILPLQRRDEVCVGSRAPRARLDGCVIELATPSGVSPLRSFRYAVPGFRSGCDQRGLERGIQVALCYSRSLNTE